MNKGKEKCEIYVEKKVGKIRRDVKSDSLIQKFPTITKYIAYDHEKQLKLIRKLKAL